MTATENTEAAETMSDELMASWEAACVRRGAELDAGERAEKQAAETARWQAARATTLAHRQSVESASGVQITDATNGDILVYMNGRYDPRFAPAAKGLYGQWSPADGKAWRFPRSRESRALALVMTYFG